VIHDHLLVDGGVLMQMALDSIEQFSHGAIGAADEEAGVDILEAGRLALECDVGFGGLEIGEQTLWGQVYEADVDIRPNKNLPLVVFQGITDQVQFSADAAQKLGAQKVTIACFLDGGGVDLKAFRHGWSEDFFVENSMGWGEAAEEVHPWS
jgi:hypothetical protein